MKLEKGIVAAICMLLLVVNPSAAQENAFRSLGARVDILSAIDTGTPQRPMFDIRVSYTFADRDQVWLGGIGWVPASGELSYKLRTARITFLDRKDGAVLALISVKATAVHQGALTEPYPSCVAAAGWSQFGVPLLVRTDVKHMFDSIDKAFRSNDPQLADLTPCDPDGGGSLVTRWMKVPAPNYTIAETATKVSYVPDPGRASGMTQVKIYYLGRERAAGEAINWQDLEGSIRNTVLQKLSKLRDSLSSP